MRKIKNMLIGGLLALPTASLAAPPIVTGSEVTEEQKIEQQETMEAQAKAQALADFFKVPLTQVQDLRTKDKLGWGEIAHLLLISQKSNQTIAAILGLRQQGKGWGEIARQYDLNLGKLNKEFHAAFRKVEKTEHPAKPAEVERPAKGSLAEEREEREERMERRHTNPSSHFREERMEREERQERIAAAEHRANSARTR